jgi:hypothetical protein
LNVVVDVAASHVLTVTTTTLHNSKPGKADLPRITELKTTASSPGKSGEPESTSNLVKPEPASPTAYEPGASTKPRTYAAAAAHTASASKKVKCEEAVRAPELKLGQLQLRDGEPGVTVTFEVLLHPELNAPGNKVFIVFGPPLSDWNVAMVQMAPKTTASQLEQEKGYVYLVGELLMPREFLCKTIPYKYVVSTSSGDIWEFIYYGPNREVVSNRCLIVPQVDRAFVKFDDVIVGSGWNEGFAKVREGRIHAVRWMLPRPSEFADPSFDVCAAVDRFDSVIQAYGHNGTRICLGNIHSVPYNPVGFSLEQLVREQIQNLLKRLKSGLKDPDVRKLLKQTLYICLVGRSKPYLKFELEHFHAVFDAFHACCDALFDDQGSIFMKLHFGPNSFRTIL